MNQDNPNRECPICFENNYIMCITKCHHTLCLLCLIKLKQYLCPICRNDISDEIPSIVTKKPSQKKKFDITNINEFPSL